MIGITSPGLWALKDSIETTTGLSPVLLDGRGAPPEVQAIAGWGRRPSAKRAATVAAHLGVPLITLEDAFFRSVGVGQASPPSGLVADRSGIYFEASTPSDLEQRLLAGGADESERQRAANCIALIRKYGLSKYNAQPPQTIEEALPGVDCTKGIVLVVDQVKGDASIAGAEAHARDFQTMLATARRENPSLPVVVKTHPAAGFKRRRHFSVPWWPKPGLHFLERPLNPWTLLNIARKVYVVSSLLGFEAATAGTEVICFGAPFYAGWGITDDRGNTPARRQRAGHRTVEDIFAAANFYYARYFDPTSKRPWSVEDTLRHLLAARTEAWRTTT